MCWSCLCTVPYSCYGWQHSSAASIHTTVGLHHCVLAHCMVPTSTLSFSAKCEHVGHLGLYIPCRCTKLIHLLIVWIVYSCLGYNINHPTMCELGMQPMSCCLSIEDCLELPDEQLWMCLVKPSLLLSLVAFKRRNKYPMHFPCIFRK